MAASRRFKSGCSRTNFLKNYNYPRMRRQTNPPIMRTPPTPAKPKNKPVHQIRHGAISASIWKQPTANGSVYNVTFQRSYKDGQDWKTSTVFGRSNLLVLSLIAGRAFEWISNQPKLPRM
jgi:hypothetical protein